MKRRRLEVGCEIQVSRWHGVKGRRFVVLDIEDGWVNARDVRDQGHRSFPRSNITVTKNAEEVARERVERAR